MVRRACRGFACTLGGLAIVAASALSLHAQVNDGGASGEEPGVRPLHVVGKEAVEPVTVVDVHCDIKPTSCPNPFNPESRGLVSAAILGSADLDVTHIDPRSIRLEGVAAIRYATDDVATPFVGDEQCDCTTDGGDGFADLTLKFRTPELAIAIAPIDLRQMRTLTFTGRLWDGTPFECSDCVQILFTVPNTLRPWGQIKSLYRD
ncbi:MAG: hypothetical protein JSW67_13515 [Candidatus Latescibacterota bacterium]|nr:MAG: hypothetical protein JSW67_13515 [Candidatus Latescibacterota bacterium]